MKHFLEICLHAVEDTLPLLPWTLLIYIVIELLQNKADIQKINRFNGRLGPLLGSATGLIPQCGFSVMAAKLFEQKYITLGTLIAIFTATSDEAFILMLSSGTGAVWVLPMLAIKLLVGVAVGYAVDGVMRLTGHNRVVAIPEAYEKEPKTTREIFMRGYLAEKDVEVNCSCGRKHEGIGVYARSLGVEAELRKCREVCNQLLQLADIVDDAVVVRGCCKRSEALNHSNLLDLYNRLCGGSSGGIKHRKEVALTLQRGTTLSLRLCTRHLLELRLWLLLGSICCRLCGGHILQVAEERCKVELGI